ncbi:hypothetical protein ACHAPG_005075 [Botrytis cinerea]
MCTFSKQKSLDAKRSAGSESNSNARSQKLSTREGCDLQRNSADGGGKLEIMSDRVDDTAHDFRLALRPRRAHHRERLLQLVYEEWKEEVEEEDREDEDDGPL